MFSSATVILLGGIVGALAYQESSVAKADQLLEETSFVLGDLVSSPLWSWLMETPGAGARREADAGSLSISVIS